MRLSSLLLGAAAAVVAIAVLLLVFGVSFHRPPAQGAALYDPSQERLITGTVKETQDFACPVSEGEMGSHLLLQTADGIIQVHLAPGRIMRSINLKFSPGDQISVSGAKVATLGRDDLIAREITRGNETIVFRDAKGKLMLVQ